jgi:SAM-dependent MidA family methyltransferase
MGSELEASLAERLRARIEAEGPLTFAEFMEAALYDPASGFYSRAPVGERGDFVTSPHLSPAFGILLANQVDEFWRMLGEPDHFSVVEVGAGDGTLGQQLLEALPADARVHTRYTAVDRSLAARRTLVERGLAVAADLVEVAGPVTGCILANELLDNVPFHRLRRTPQRVAEVYVGWREGGFVLEEGPVSRPELTDRLPQLDVGAEWPVRPLALRFVDEVRRVLSRGYVWVADYAIREGEDASIHSYRGHRVEGDVLGDPGSRDITAGVDFGDLKRHAEERGLSVWGPVAQRYALLRLGFRELDRRAQARQIEALGHRRGIEALRIYSNRARANLLLGRGGLGDFSVLCLGIGVDEPPRAFREADS